MNQEIFDRMKKISERLKKSYNAEKVILFGSYARGEETEDSDVDLLVIAPLKERFFERIALTKRLIRDLRNGLPVSPIVLTPEETEKRKKIGDQFILDILKDGVLLDDAARYNPELENFRDLCERVSGYYMAQRYPPLGNLGLRYEDIKRDLNEAEKLIKAMFPYEKLK